MEHMKYVLALDQGTTSSRAILFGRDGRAVALPAGTGAPQIAALRVRAHTRRPRKGEPALPKGAARARLTSVNRLFLLDAEDTPGPDLLTWRGDAPLAVDGAPYEIAIAR